MPNWMLKAGIQRVISRLPNSSGWNYFFQKHITGSIQITDEWFTHKVEQCRKHLEHYIRFSHDGVLPQQILEIGTGWHPIMLIGFFLCGIERCITIDISPMLKKENIRETLNWYVRYAREGKLAKALPLMREERLQEVRELADKIDDIGLDEALYSLLIRTIVSDAGESKLYPGSIDLIVSNNTLEHIQAKEFERMFPAWRHLLAGTGVMSHFIDLSDHYSHFDPTITSFNFLQFSDEEWERFNTSLGIQNRLRISDYRDLHTEAGFSIVLEEDREGTLENLRSVRMHERFRRYRIEDLRVTHAWLVSVPGTGPVFH